MTEGKDTEKKKTVDSFTDIFRTFGDAVSEILNDPELKRRQKNLPILPPIQPKRWLIGLRMRT
jgi:hypothetical protein